MSTLGITVRTALELPELAGIQVVGGFGGLDRVIRSVNIMETPDVSRFVEPGEFLLTTTFPIARDQAAMQQLVPTLAKRKLAALAIKPVHYIDDIPAEMVRQADELDFPLLSIPPDAPFAGILNPILTEILHRQTALLRRSEEVHRSLTNLVLRGEGLEAVARTLVTLLGLPVLIADHQFRILAHGGQATAADEDLAGFVRKMHVEALYPTSGESIRRSFWSESRLSTVLIHPVRVGQEVDGYICVWEKEGELRERDVICVEQGALVTAIEIQKRKAVQETERRFYNEFLRDLLAGRVATRDEAIARGRVYEMDLAQQRVLILFHLIGASGSEISVDLKLRCQNRIEKAIYYSMEEPSSANLLTHLGDTSILLLVPQRSGSAEAKEEAMKVAQRVLNELEPDSKTMAYSLHIGVSRVQEDVLRWNTAYQQAQEALRIQMQLSDGCSLTHYDDLGVYRLIARISDLDELERYCKEQIGALIDYDVTHGTDLMGTLKAVIEADGNLHRASEALMVHYNTLRYRVRRIEEIQGTKIDSWSRMSSVDIALKGFRVLKTKRARQSARPLPSRWS